MEPAAADVRADARWHLFDLRPEARKFTLVRLEEATYRSASFLDQRVTGQAREGYQYPFSRREAFFPPGAAPEAAPMYLFHVGHCGSTLLSRALAADDAVLPVREPLTLRALADARRDAAHPWRMLSAAEWAAWLDAVHAAHARGFREGQRALVKATSHCNNLVGPLLERDPRARALLLYVPLETYLAGMLKREEPPADLLGFARARVMDWQALAGAPSFSLDALSRPEQAALAWMTSMRQLLAAAEAFPGRTRLMDFDAFLADPQAHLPAAAAFLGLEGLSAKLVRAYPELASRYAKDPSHPYSAQRRARVLEAVATRDAAAIRQGLAWAEARSAEAPVFEPCLRHLTATEG